MVYAERPVGRGARGIGAAAREERPEFLVVQDAAVAVVGHAYFIRLFHIGRARVVAADPGSQPGPRVGPDGHGCPIQSAEGLVFPKQILAPVRGEEGVRHPKFEHAELGPGLQVERLPDVKFER